MIAYKIFTNTLPFTSAATMETNWIQEMSLKITRNEISEADFNTISEPYRSLIRTPCLVTDNTKRAQNVDELIHTIQQYAQSDEKTILDETHLPIRELSLETPTRAVENTFEQTKRATDDRPTIKDDKPTIKSGVIDEDSEPSKSIPVFWIAGGAIALLIGGYWYSQKDNTTIAATTNIQSQDIVATSAPIDATPTIDQAKVTADAVKKDVKPTINPEKAAADAAKAEALKQKLKGIGQGSGGKKTDAVSEWSTEYVEVPHHADVMQPKL